MNTKISILIYSFLISLTIVSTNLFSNPFDDIGAGTDILKKVIDKKKEKEKEKEKAKKREQERLAYEQESQRRKEEQDSLERKKTQDFYNLFSDRGTKVITETKTYKDDFGDPQEITNHYIVANDMKFDVYVPPGVCPSEESTLPFDLSKQFPFRVNNEFDDYLNYEKSGFYLGYVRTKYKLSDGTKGVHMNGVIVKKSEMKYFSMDEGEDEPLSLNMVSYREMLKTDPDASGALTMVIVGATDSKNILFTFNPFHSSWLNLYKSHCKI